MPERFEIYIVYKRHYINTLPFLFSFTIYVALYLYQTLTGYQNPFTDRHVITVLGQTFVIIMVSFCVCKYNCCKSPLLQADPVMRCQPAIMLYTSVDAECDKLVTDNCHPYHTE